MSFDGVMAKKLVYSFSVAMACLLHFSKTKEIVENTVEGNIENPIVQNNKF